METAKGAWKRWRQTRWWVRWLTYVVTVVVGFYMVEDVRGYLALEQAKAEYLAAGFRLDVDEIRGEPIPHEENFAMHEVIAGDPFRGSKMNEAMEELQSLTRQTLDSSSPHHGYHGPIDGLSTYLNSNSNETRPKMRIKACLQALEPYFAEIEDACARPSCDWLVDFDRSDWVSSPTQDSQMSVAEWALRIQTLQAGQNDPELAAKNVNALFKMGGFRSPLNYGRFINPLLESGTLLTAWGLSHQIWSENELKAIYDAAVEGYAEHTWVNALELLVAGPIMEQFGRTSACRNLLIDIVEYDKGFVSLPGSIWGWETSDLENLLNRMIIRIMPRGWVWQNQASLLSWVAHPEAGVEFNPYTVFLYSGSSHLFEGFELIEEHRVRGELLRLAIEAELYFREHGQYPAQEAFENLPEFYGYRIGSGGRPEFWVNTDESVSSETDFDLEDRKHSYLWRYPTEPN